MAEQKIKGVPFAVALNTSPRQYGLTGFKIVRHNLDTAGALMPPVDITGSVDIDEFENTVPAYAGSPVVSTKGFAKSERIGISDPDKEIHVGDIISLGGAVYAVLGVDVNVAGDGTLDLALPLRADVEASTPIVRSGRTGNYRFTITETAVGSVQYRVTAADAYPAIDITSQVLDIITGEGGAVVDNSKLLL